jgi:hypothetical protein
MSCVICLDEVEKKKIFVPPHEVDLGCVVQTCIDCFKTYYETKTVCPLCKQQLDIKACNRATGNTLMNKFYIELCIMYHIYFKWNLAVYLVTLAFMMLVRLSETTDSERFVVGIIGFIVVAIFYIIRVMWLIGQVYQKLIFTLYNMSIVSFFRFFVSGVCFLLFLLITNANIYIWIDFISEFQKKKIK